VNEVSVLSVNVGGVDFLIVTGLNLSFVLDAFIILIHLNANVD
jgi:hypothetical protein